MTVAGHLDVLLSIGEACARFGVAPSTLRYWEGLGLVHAVRLPGGTRHYDRRSLLEIALVQVCKEWGLTLEETAVVCGGGDDAERKAVLRRRRDAIVASMDDLVRARANLDEALSCPEPHPLACEGFVDELARRAGLVA